MSEQESIFRPDEKLEAEIRRRLDYDPETGVFRWRIKVPKRNPGDVAGGKSNEGYVQFHIFGRSLQAHRVAWWLVHGRWPSYLIDHINGDGSDNRIVNLREATRSQNTFYRNKPKRPKSGFYGVYPSKHGNAWVASLQVRKQKVRIGTFLTAEDAARARDAKARELMGEFAVLNFPDELPVEIPRPIKQRFNRAPQRGMFLRGAAAAKNGEPRNPPTEARLGWPQVYRKHWLDGYDSVKA